MAPHLDRLASLDVIKCKRMHLLLIYGTLLNMQLTWFFSPIKSACVLRNGRLGSKHGQVVMVSMRHWSGNIVILGETVQRCPWEVDSGRIKSSMRVISLILARQPLVPRSILLVLVIFGIFQVLVRKSQNKALLVLLACQRNGIGVNVWVLFGMELFILGLLWKVF